jgi:hypothetical protein
VKLLLDTNVLVAALVARGTCSDLLEHCVRQHHVISSEPMSASRSASGNFRRKAGTTFETP